MLQVLGVRSHLSVRITCSSHKFLLFYFSNVRLFIYVLNIYVKCFLITGNMLSDTILNGFIWYFLYLQIPLEEDIMISTLNKAKRTKNGKRNELYSIAGKVEYLQNTQTGVKSKAITLQSTCPSSNSIPTPRTHF